MDSGAFSDSTVSILLAGGGDGFVVIYDVCCPPGPERHTFPSVGTVALNNRHRHKFSVETVLWYPLDTGMFTSSGADCMLKVWDTNRLKPADEYQFSGIVNCHHMSPIATRHCLVAVATNSSTVKLVDLKSGSSSHSLKGHDTSVFVVKFSPYNEFILASGRHFKAFMITDYNSVVTGRYYYGTSGMRRAASYSLTSTMGGNPRTYLKITVSALSHNNAVNGLQFSSDGIHIVSCSTDNAVRLWNTSTGKNVGVDYGAISNRAKKCVQFAVSDGCSQDLVFIPNDTRRSVDALNMVTGKREYSLTGHYSYVNCCLYHPDLNELYSGANDRNILVWTPKTFSSQYRNVRKRRRERVEFKCTEKQPKRSTEKHDSKITVSSTAKSSISNGISAGLSGIETTGGANTALTADSWSSDEDT
ncbi:ERCC8-like protein [Mya arenaria]|uniref:ERCC8-like protein n=1 Tax=Mya arenaria TaxID=6604 RepID=A0ABY7FPP7_MYAAR|nr:ERCC8-like protein [Mya arenaria]